MTFRFDPDRRSHFAAAAASLTALGFVLRLLAARGDLWLDEVLSVSAVGRLRSAGEVFWGIPHANNHFLNSLWIYVVGQHASVLAYRFPAVLLGAASVPASGWVARRHGTAAILVTMLFFSTNFVMIEYGSEARGYSGLILFTLLATGCARYAAEPMEPKTRHFASWMLGVCIGLGFLCHVLMAIIAAILSLSMFVEKYRVLKSWARAFFATATFMFPGALLLAPVAGVLLAEIGRFDWGSYDAFQPWYFWTAYGTLLLYVLSLATLFPYAALSAALAVTLTAIGDAVHNRWRDSLYVISLAVLPLLLFTLRPGNSHIPRYFLPFAIFFLLALGERIGVASRGTARARFLARTALMVLVVLGAAQTASYLVNGRGEYTALFRDMAKYGTIRYGTNSGSFVTVMNYYVADLHKKTAEVPETEWCSGHPDWLILTREGTASSDELLARVQKKCGFVLNRVFFSGGGLSQTGWNIFRVSQSREP